jgi:hypothetical protein
MLAPMLDQITPPCGSIYEYLAPPGACSVDARDLQRVIVEGGDAEGCAGRFWGSKHVFGTRERGGKEGKGYVYCGTDGFGGGRVSGGEGLGCIWVIVASLEGQVSDAAREGALWIGWRVKRRTLVG